MIKTIKVSEKGQIAIPRQMREEMGISKGDELIVIQKGEQLLLQKMQRVERRIEDDFKDILRLSESALKEVWDNPGDEVWKEYLK